MIKHVVALGSALGVEVAEFQQILEADPEVGNAGLTIAGQYGSFG
jgi:hypothetical protein